MLPVAEFTAKSYILSATITEEENRKKTSEDDEAKCGEKEKGDRSIKGDNLSFKTHDEKAEESGGGEFIEASGWGQWAWNMFNAENRRLHFKKKISISDNYSVPLHSRHCRSLVGLTDVQPPVFDDDAEKIAEYCIPLIVIQFCGQTSDLNNQVGALKNDVTAKIALLREPDNEIGKLTVFFVQLNE